MTSSAVAALLSDGRLHLQHGPIDLIIEAHGKTENIEIANQAMTKRFSTVLDELVVELTQLRQDVRTNQSVTGTISRRMLHAAQKFGDVFVTPMAAVAGAVADEIVETGWASAELKTLYVNNGGDIAFRVSPGEEMVVGVAKSVTDGTLIGRLHFSAASNIRGVATSGFGGRSRTFGIADAVTVVSSCAADADVAATLIANEVSLGIHPQITVAPANSLDASSDLGDRVVTTFVGDLTAQEITTALENGVKLAHTLFSKGDIDGVFLVLRGIVKSAGSLDFK